MVKICEVVDGCGDCPKYGDDCDGDKMAEHTDLISRADAIEAVRESCGGIAHSLNDILSNITVYKKAKAKLQALPSADAVQGEWIWRTDIPIGDGRTSAGYICSNCGKDYWHGNVFKYCPNCGTRMKGGENE